MSSSEPRRSKKWNEYVTVEPTMFFYMFAFQLTSVIEQELFVQKACRVNLNHSAKICDHLSNQNNTDISKEVQVSAKGIVLSVLNKKNLTGTNDRKPFQFFINGMA